MTPARQTHQKATTNAIAKSGKLGLRGATSFVSSDDDDRVCDGMRSNIFEGNIASAPRYVSSSEATLTAPSHPRMKRQEVGTERFSSRGYFLNFFGVQKSQRESVSVFFDQAEDTLCFEGYQHSAENSGRQTGGVFEWKIVACRWSFTLSASI